MPLNLKAVSIGIKGKKNFIKNRKWKIVDTNLFETQNNCSKNVNIKNYYWQMPLKAKGIKQGVANRTHPRVADAKVNEKKRINLMWKYFWWRHKFYTAKNVHRINYSIRKSVSVHSHILIPFFASIFCGSEKKGKMVAK